METKIGSTGKHDTSPSTELREGSDPIKPPFGPLLRQIEIHQIERRTRGDPDPVDETRDGPEETTGSFLIKVERTKPPGPAGVGGEDGSSSTNTGNQHQTDF